MEKKSTRKQNSNLVHPINEVDSPMRRRFDDIIRDILPELNFDDRMQIRREIWNRWWNNSQERSRQVNEAYQRHYGFSIRTDKANGATQYKRKWESIFKAIEKVEGSMPTRSRVGEFIAQQRRLIARLIAIERGNYSHVGFAPISMRSRDGFPQPMIDLAVELHDLLKNLKVPKHTRKTEAILVALGIFTPSKSSPFPILLNKWRRRIATIKKHMREDAQADQGDPYLFFEKTGKIG